MGLGAIIGDAAGQFAGSLFSKVGDIYANYGNTLLQNYANERFMNRYMQQWGSPQAQMESMRAAGINPYVAAENISGNSGFPASAVSEGSNIAGDLNTLANANATNVKTPSEVRNLDADSTGKELENEVTKDTLEDKKQFIRDEARKMGFDADTVEKIAKWQDQLSEWTVDNLKKKSAEMESNKKLIDKQKDLVDKEIKQIDEQIKEIKQRINTMISEEDLNNARTALTNKEKEKVQKEIEKQEIENKKMEYDTDDPVATYNYIKNTKGEKAANDWWNDMKDKAGELEKHITEKKTEGEVNVKYGHEGMVGQTVDAIRRFTGNSKDYGVSDILDGFGIYFDDNGYPQFRPIVEATNWVARLFGSGKPDYDKWSSSQKKEINRMLTDANNQYKQGKISKDEWKQIHAEVEELKKYINEDYYNELFK